MFWRSSRDLSIKLSALAAGAVVAATVLHAPGADADANPAEQPGAPVAGVVPVIEAPALDAAPAPESVPVPAPEFAPAPAPEGAPAPAAVPGPAPEGAPAPDAAPVADAAAEGPMMVPAAHVHDAHPRALPPGVGPEEGLQVQTIRVERNICAEFPQIRNIIGVRPDSKPWHPSGRAIDIMIPDAGSESGIALGNAIRDFALRNAADLGIMDVIWRGTYYTPAGPSGSGYGHYDHVHITTFGGGYPSGGEEYLAEE